MCNEVVSGEWSPLTTHAFATSCQSEDRQGSGYDRIIFADIDRRVGPGGVLALALQECFGQAMGPAERAVRRRGCLDLQDAENASERRPVVIVESGPGRCSIGH